MKIQANRHRFRMSLAIWPAIFLGIAGSLPHLFFSFDTGKPSFFESAWDESFYALVMSGKIANWNDYPVRALERVLLLLSGGPNFTSAVLSDMIWPAAVAVAAGFLTLTVVRGWVAVIPVIFCLVFANDILAFDSSIIYPPSWMITARLRLWAPDVRSLFSDPYTSFLYLYRTPEPQLSLPLFFCYLALLIRFLRLEVIRSCDWVLLWCGGFVCALIYPFFAIASFAIGGLGAGACIVTRRWKTGLGILAITGIAALSFLVLLTMSHASEADATRFSSSLPMLAPSLLYGLILLPTFAWIFRDRLRSDAEIAFALLCFLLPFALLNQQVLTGTMIQTLNWERYIDYLCIVVGTVILLGKIDWARQFSRGPRFVGFRDRFSAVAGHRSALISSGLMLGLLGIFLYCAQLNTYRQYVEYNLVAAAYSAAADQFYSAKPAASHAVTLDRESYDALVRVRMKTPGVSLASYTDLLGSLKSPGVETDHVDATKRSLVHRNWGFEHAARLGFSRAAYEAQLISEVDSLACWPNLMFHFSFLECAPYVSDFRTYFPAKLKEAIPSIADAYQEYRLRHINGQEVFGEALVLSTTPLQAETPSPWKQEAVGVIELSTRVNGFAPPLTARIYAYWQRPL